MRRKTDQLETLNRELEQRVAERTVELNQRAEALQLLNIELARKNQELDAIVRTAPDIIFSRRADGARDYISARFYDYTGARPNSASGFGWMDYVHPDDKERSMERWLHCVQSGENYECEYRLRGRDTHTGRPIPMVSRPGGAASRPKRRFNSMVRNLLGHSRQQAG